MQNVDIPCLNCGSRYGPHYLNTPYRAAGRNLSRLFRCFCCTDGASGLNASTELTEK